MVVAAKGPHFSVGLDLSVLAELGSAGAGSEEDGPRNGGPSAAELARRTHADVLRLQAPFNAVADCPKPVIAAVHGYCIGGGVDLMSACDIRVCSADTIFSVRETKMAIVADIGSLQRLPLILSMGHVAELAYTGKDIDCRPGVQIGLVNDVFADQAAMLAGAQGRSPRRSRPTHPSRCKARRRCSSQIHRAQVDAGLRYVAAWNAGQLRSHDLNEAVTAFFERRPPKFTGTGGTARRRARPRHVFRRCGSLPEPRAALLLFRRNRLATAFLRCACPLTRLGQSLRRDRVDDLLGGLEQDRPIRRRHVAARPRPAARRGLPCSHPASAEPPLVAGQSSGQRQGASGARSSTQNRATSPDA